MSSFTSFLVSILIIAGTVVIGTFSLKLQKTTDALAAKEVDECLKQNQFQGAVLIAKGGRSIFSKGYGFANVEHKILNTAQTVFRIGSITKEFTAVAILQLEEKEKLRTSDPIAKYLSDYPHGDIITIHHLLSHTSGIRSITDFPNLSDIQRHPSTPERVISFFKNLALNFEPGEDCDYSDSGYIILGAIIEIVSNQSYENYIQANILNPLKMNSTFYENSYSIIPQRASGYRKNNRNEILNSNYIDMSFPHAAGGMVSTVEDLYIFIQALTEGSFLSKEQCDQLFTIHGTSETNHITYGYGFFIGPQNAELELANRTIVGHYGIIEGFRASSFRYHDDELTIILLSNLENTDINTLHLSLASILRASWRSNPAI